MRKVTFNRVIVKIVKKSLISINSGFVNITCKIAKMCGYEGLTDAYMKSMVKCYEKNTDYYAAYKIIAKKSEKVFSIEEENDYDGQVGIIIQGPLVLKDHFTLETIRIYRKLFPSAKVILSTWENENKEELELIAKEKNCTIVTSKVPDDPGVLNVNLQCISTRSGILKAEELELKYVAKTRTDWRMYHQGAVRFMIHLLETFPCKEYLFKQNKRIIAMDIATDETSILFYPFWISDIFQFGEIQDMKNYWDHPVSKQGKMTKGGLDEHIRTNKYSWSRRAKEGLLIEARLAIDYYRRMTGNEPIVTVDEYWKFMKGYFMVIPRSMIGGYWFKYEERRILESMDWGTCFKNDSQDSLLTYNFDFVSWLNLLSDDLNYDDSYKTMCDRRCYVYRQ